jgi:hypothetical protein
MIRPLNRRRISAAVSVIGPPHLAFGGLESFFHGHAGLSPRVSRDPVASRAWWRQAAAMWGSRRALRIPMPRLRRVAMAWGTMPVRIREASQPVMRRTSG